MATERQKYVSGALKTAGFGFIAPIGSTIFQWLVFEKSTYFGHALPSLLTSGLGIIIMYIGYKILPKDK